jgi:hypothetical protein
VAYSQVVSSIWQKIRENAARAADEQPDGIYVHIYICTRAVNKQAQRELDVGFSLAGLGQGVAAGCGRDVTTLLPQPSLSLALSVSVY